jgi:hypothetical protein
LSARTGFGNPWARRTHSLPTFKSSTPWCRNSAGEIPRDIGNGAEQLAIGHLAAIRDQGHPVGRLGRIAIDE